MKRFCSACNKVVSPVTKRWLTCVKIPRIYKQLPKYDVVCPECGKVFEQVSDDSLPCKTVYFGPLTEEKRREVQDAIGDVEENRKYW